MNSYVSVVFFFEHTVSRELLLTGLGQALGHMPIVAGRLRLHNGTVAIVCDNSGVSVSTQSVDLTLSQAIREAITLGPILVNHVDISTTEVSQRPLLTVCLSVLADDGLAVGCSWQHSVGDMTSFMLFMRTWSAYCEGTSPPRILVVPDRDDYLDKTLPDKDSGQSTYRLLAEDERRRLAHEISLGPRHNRTMRINFSDHELRCMRKRFNEVAGSSISLNDALSAHMFAALRQISREEFPNYLLIAVDFRRRLGLPSALVGNMVDDISLLCSPGEAAEDLAARIRTGMDNFAQSHLSQRSNRALADTLGRHCLRACAPIALDPARPTFIVTNWSRTGAYEITFSGQRPTYFSPVTNRRIPWIATITGGFNDRGLLFDLVLPAPLAEQATSPAGLAAIHLFRESGHADGPEPDAVIYPFHS